VLVHVHVPKNAGTAVRAWLFKAYPSGFGSWYPNYVFDENTLAAAGLGDLRLRAISTHWIRRFVATACERRMRYFTLLRNPVDQVLSAVRYRHQIVAEANRDAAGATRKISMRDSVAELLAQNDPFRDNMQTNFFALYAWCDTIGTKFGCDPATYTEWPSDLRLAYQYERLRVAKDVLRGFTAVGTVERIIDSLDLLRERTERLGFNLLDSQEITLENVTRVQADDLSWINEDDTVGSRLLSSLRDDWDLYRYAQYLLDEPRKLDRPRTAPSLLKSLT
jgi:hypothetical protein